MLMPLSCFKTCKGARIKKIMQADEDIGKIANAVPLLVSKALELFLQDLCDRTYDVTLKRGAKTLNSYHLKQCVQTCNVFDFLKDVVSKVPDLGVSDGDDRSAAKRRKIAEADDHYSDDDIKRSDMTTLCEKLEDAADPRDEKQKKRNPERLDSGSETADSKVSLAGQSLEAPVRNFDLNVDLNDDAGDSSAVPAEAAPSPSPTFPSVETKHEEEYPGWNISNELEFLKLLEVLPWLHPNLGLIHFLLTAVARHQCYVVDGPGHHLSFHVQHLLKLQLRVLQSQSKN
nr:dr1-associated corepressor-like isoform X2 [Ipomoea batatas]GME04278.1 dr1-associated corepressor-like isoform X2 [Ipomoea batatas]